MTEPAEPLAALAADALERLRAAGVEPEAIGVYEPPRRRLLVGRRPARIVPAGRGWRLGVLLLDEAGRLLVAGETLRARTPPPILGYASESARERDALRHCAIRGGFAEGETVHWGARPLDFAALDGGGDAGPGGAAPSPVALRDGRLVVRWAPGAPLASATPIERYLDERVRLLIDPPERA